MDPYLSDPYLRLKWPKITNIHLTTYMGDFLTELYFSF